MEEIVITRRRMLGAMGVAYLGVVAGCGSVGDDGGGGGGSSSDAIKVGLVVPQSGVYAPLGADMKAAWDLYLTQNGGKFGERTVTTIVADEGEGPDTGVPAVQRVLQRDQVDAVVGIVNSAVALGAKDIMTAAKKLLIVSNAGANDLTAKNPSPYVWRTSFTNDQVAFAMGEYLAEQPDGQDGAFAIAADYAAGNEAIAGFKRGFTSKGGRIVGEAGSPFGTTQDFQPYLSRIRRSGAGACYCFYAGAEAVAFVKQYAEFGLPEQIPLYGSGFLTEGGVLRAQGRAADGVKTALYYAAALDNAANKKFAADYQAAAGRPPTVYSAQTWDAAALLNQITADADALDGDTLSEALKGVGEFSDSPRGPWSFEQQSPKQTQYLRQVVTQGGARTNRVEEDLGVYSPIPTGSTS